MWNNIKILNQLDDSGGMGDIYIAYHSHFGANYALKKLKGELARTKDIKRFTREINIIKELFHKNIIRIVDFSQDSENLGYAMEYCPSGNIEKYLKVNQLSQNEIIDHFWKIASALNFCHNQESPIIHRDIKPQNILIGLDTEPKLSDFGLAIILDNNEERITTSNWVSNGFSPPEQYFDFKNCDEKSDIYSLGATFYYLLTKNYYDSVNPNFEKIENNNIAFILARMLETEKAKRFNSVSEIFTTFEVLNSNIEIQNFHKLAKDLKKHKIDEYLSYYCGMENDILYLNKAIETLNQLKVTEYDQDILKKIDFAIKHIDQQGQQLDNEMDQDRIH